MKSKRKPTAIEEAAAIATTEFLPSIYLKGDLTICSTDADLREVVGDFFSIVFSNRIPPAQAATAGPVLVDFCFNPVTVESYCKLLEVLGQQITTKEANDILTKCLGEPRSGDSWPPPLEMVADFMAAVKETGARVGRPAAPEAIKRLAMTLLPLLSPLKK